MIEIYCRIITTHYKESAAHTIKEFVTRELGSIGISSITFLPFVPYWKNPSQGELSFHFLTDTALETVHSLFADTWQSDTADIQWSQIHCPNTAFLWISN